MAVFRLMAVLITSARSVAMIASSVSTQSGPTNFETYPGWHSSEHTTDLPCVSRQSCAKKVFRE
jgi:hypothetical protein